MFDIINTLAFNVIKMLQFTHSLYYSVFHVYYSILTHILQYFLTSFYSSPIFRTVHKKGIDSRDNMIYNRLIEHMFYKS